MLEGCRFEGETVQTFAFVMAEQLDILSGLPVLRSRIFLLLPDKRSAASSSFDLIDFVIQLASAQLRLVLDRLAFLP